MIDLRCAVFDIVDRFKLVNEEEEELELDGVWSLWI